MFDLISRWRAARRKRRLQRVMIADDLWNVVWRSRIARYGLAPDEERRLHELASLFDDEKVVSGVGLEPSDLQRYTIAALACLPILELGLEWYRGWVEVILYPDTFVARHQTIDEAGVVHEEVSARGGESWDQGPVVLSWGDIEWQEDEGYNVVLHEFAHKLDMLNGAADGLPPLHRDMSRSRWSEVLGAAYDDLSQYDEADPGAWMDPYGAQSPAEFFAVASEAFFDTPAALDAAQPALYDQLRAFYRQDPLRRTGDRRGS